MTFATDFVALKNSISAYALLVKNKFSSMMPASDRGALNGVAPLVNGLVPSQYLPSYVDDVLEYFGTANFPAIGENGKIYVDTSSTELPAYRWTGSGYMQINNHVSNADSSITAVRLATPRTISTSGDATWSVTFDGSGNATAVMTLNTVPVSKGGTGGINPTQAQTNLGVLIGTNVQAYSGDLAAIAALAATGGFLKKVNTNQWAVDTNTYVTAAGTVAAAAQLTGVQQTNPLLGSQSSMAMSADAGATRGSLIARATGAGDANLAGMVFWNDAYAIKMGVRADGYFGLGGWSRAAWSWYSDPNGNMVAAGNVSAYSDPRLKDNVVVIENALDICDALDGVFFNWNNRSKLVANPGKRDIGFLANQVKAILPMLVTPSIIDEENNEIYDTVDYAKMAPVLLQAIKNLHTKVRILEGK